MKRLNFLKKGKLVTCILHILGWLDWRSQGCEVRNDSKNIGPDRLVPSFLSSLICFRAAKCLSMPGRDIDGFAPVGSGIHTILPQRRNRRTQVISKRSHETGRGDPSTPALSGTSLMQPSEKAWCRYGVLGWAHGHPAAPNPGWFETT